VATREQRDPWVVVALRDEDADVDAVTRGTHQRLDLRPARDEVRIGDPDRALRRDGLHLERTGDAHAERLSLDDADERRLGGGRVEVRAARHAAREPMRAAALSLPRTLPHRVERVVHVARSGALDTHGGVAPVAAMVRGGAHPLVADADAARDADGPVDHE